MLEVLSEKREKSFGLSHTLVILYLKRLCSVSYHTRRVVLDWFWLHSYSVFYCSYHRRRTLKTALHKSFEHFFSPKQSRLLSRDTLYTSKSSQNHHTKSAFLSFPVPLRSQRHFSCLRRYSLNSNFTVIHKWMHRTNEQANKRCCIANVFTLFTLYISQTWLLTRRNFLLISLNI